MNDETIKRVRFNLRVKILSEIGLRTGNKEFSDWIWKIGIYADTGKGTFEELYAEVDDFIKSNYDLVELLTVLKTECFATSIKEPLRVTCDR